MESSVIYIALITNDAERVEYVKSSLKKAHTAISRFSFEDIFTAHIGSDPYDLILLDYPTCSSLELNEIYSLRKEKLLEHIPFLFILDKDQQGHRDEIFKDNLSGFIAEPFDQFEFLQQVRNLVSLGQLEQQVYYTDDVVESEKKIIHYLDTLLQIPSMSQCSSPEEFFFLLQEQFVQRMALTFAAEMVLYLEYSSMSKSLVLKHYGKDQEDIKKKILFNVKKSKVQDAFAKNSAIIFKDQMRLDPFIQELEESINIEIKSLLFTPFSVLHKPQGAFAVINKLYRNSFSDNDLALSLITVHKLAYQLETIYLRGSSDVKFDDFLKRDYAKLDDEKDYHFYKDILESIRFGLMIFNQDYQILFLNKFALQALGLESAKSLSLEDAIGHEAQKDIATILKGEELPSLRQEMMVNRLENRPFYMGYSIYRISAQKKNNIYAITFMEISQSKRLQAEIIRMDRMASLGVLASGIAHEIRNPLAGIKAMAQTLEEELHDQVTKMEYVQRIVRQVNRLDELLKSFFSYAKPQRPNPVRCNIPDIVHEVLPLFRRKIKENNIIVKEIYSRDLKHVFVDFHQIEQVIFNMVINAIDAMKNGGTMTIQSHLSPESEPLIDRRQRIPKLFSDVYNEIIFTDEGVGMDGHTMNSMYNPFFTTKTNGTGLGLSIVYQIILEHGGQITVDSQIGKGTTFKILLPVYVEKESQ
jgi:nitrogen-specific signal transduction histidine kinase/CheY-like chemotaxis protein